MFLSAYVVAPHLRAKLTGSKKRWGFKALMARQTTIMPIASERATA